jgi:hypothetical protein
VLAVGLREHHQLDVGGVALQAGEGVDQVVDLVVGQRQAPLLVGGLQRGAAAAQHIHKLHGRGLQGEQLRPRRAWQTPTRSCGRAAARLGRCSALSSGLPPSRPDFSHAVFGDALHAEHPGRSCGRCRWPWRPRARPCPGAA